MKSVSSWQLPYRRNYVLWQRLLFCFSFVCVREGVFVCEGEGVCMRDGVFVCEGEGVCIIIVHVFALVLCA